MGDQPASRLLGSTTRLGCGRTVTSSWELMFIAAGAITGMRVCASMLLGQRSAGMMFVPILQASGVIEGVGFAASCSGRSGAGSRAWWPRACSHFALQWRTALRAFAISARCSARARAGAELIRMAAIETPTSWFVGGPARLARRARVARPRHLRHAVLAERGGGARCRSRWRWSPAG